MIKDFISTIEEIIQMTSAKKKQINNLYVYCTRLQQNKFQKENFILLKNFEFLNVKKISEYFENLN